MSKMIKINSEYIAQYVEEFRDAINSGKFSDGKITFTRTIGRLDRKAKVFFDELAWVKMHTLIRDFDKEVAWHGVAYRGEETDTYHITDILVYPQEVTGATVSTDQEKYQMWLMGHEDEVFNNIRMQGHSHVNMGVTPSSVDVSLYESLLEQLDDDMFYIFMIWNKKKDKMIKIYDIKENVLFETADVTIEVIEDGTGIEKFMENANAMVVDKPKVSYKTSYQNYYGDHVGMYGYGDGVYSGVNYNSCERNTKSGETYTSLSSDVKKGRQTQKKKSTYAKLMNLIAGKELEAGSI